jgi:uridylate kinase
MDASAVSLARENKIPIIVCSIAKNKNLTHVLNGKGSYTIISD